MGHPWDQPAPERPGRPSVWAALPEDFAAQGAPGRPEHLFTQLQHPWAWREGHPFLAKATRTWLSAAFETHLPEVVERHPSEDGSTKLVLALQDGQRIEAVHMPRAVRSPRVTLCLSSQVGCAMGCAFCATGKMGLLRNLQAWEIVEQVRAFREELPKLHHIRSVVFQGMGEPLANFEQVVAAIAVLSEPHGLAIERRSITVCTSGLAPGILRLAREAPSVRLGVSLGSLDPQKRRELMPVSSRYPLAEVLAAAAEHARVTHHAPMFAFTLLAGVSDRDEDADALCRLSADFAAASGVRPRISLIPFNPIDATELQRPTMARIAAFRDRMAAGGVHAILRYSGGGTVGAACGQLAPNQPAPSPG